MTVDSQDNGSPVIKLLSKQHQNNKENVLPSTLRATRSTQSPVNRQILRNLTNKSTLKHQSRLDQIIEEGLSARRDEDMPQVNNQKTNHPICHSGKGPKLTSIRNRQVTKQQQSDSESDDAVTLKTPTKITSHREIVISDRSTDKEIIKSDE